VEQTEHGFVQKGDSSMSRNKKEMGNAGKPEHPTTSRMASEQPSVQKHSAISETWAQETIEDLDDFIESQGIYIRQ
jgi:hypothetical protein